MRPHRIYAMAQACVNWGVQRPQNRFVKSFFPPCNAMPFSFVKIGWGKRGFFFWPGMASRWRKNSNLKALQKIALQNQTAPQTLSTESATERARPQGERERVSQTVRPGVDGRWWAEHGARLQMSRKQCQADHQEGVGDCTEMRVPDDLRCSSSLHICFLG